LISLLDPRLLDRPGGTQISAIVAEPEPAGGVKPDGGQIFHRVLLAGQGRGGSRRNAEWSYAQRPKTLRDRLGPLPPWDSQGASFDSRRLTLG